MHKIPVDFSDIGGFNPTPEEAYYFMLRHLPEALRNKRLAYKIRTKKIRVASKIFKKEGLEWQY